MDFSKRESVTVKHCETHGNYEPRRNWDSCPACDRERTRILMEEDLKREWRLGSGLRGRFSNAAFATFQAESPEQRAALAVCQSYVETLDFVTWRPLWLIGRPGTGKSHLVSAMVSACIETRHKPAAIATAREIVRALRSTWRRGAAESEQDVLDRFTGVPLLALDELGVGFGSDGELGQLLEVVDGRYQRNLPTVIASNLSAPQLSAALGERLVDRLRENFQAVVFDWPSRRGRNATPTVA